VVGQAVAATGALGHAMEQPDGAGLRLVLHRRIDLVQCSWVNLGPEQCARVLAGGVAELGGTSMEETVS
jgi:2-iminoacetate synthase ThiH